MDDYENLNDITMYLAVIGNGLFVISELLPFLPCFEDGILEWLVSPCFKTKRKRAKIEYEKSKQQVLELKSALREKENLIIAHELHHMKECIYYKNELEKSKHKIGKYRRYIQSKLLDLNLNENDIYKIEES